MESNGVFRRARAALFLGCALVSSSGCSTTRLDVVRDDETTRWTSLQERSFRENATFAWRPEPSFSGASAIREMLSPGEPFDFPPGDSLVVCLRRIGAAAPDASARVPRAVLVVALPMKDAASGSAFDATALQVAYYEDDGQPGGLVLVARSASGIVRLDLRTAHRVDGTMDLKLEAMEPGRSAAASRHAIRVDGDFSVSRRS